MKTVFANMLPAMGAVVVLVSGTALMPGTGAQGKPESAAVRVVNTTAEPVPTLAVGTTAVAGEVTIGGIPAVTIVNGPRSPIPVHMPNPAREAYQVEDTLRLGFDQLSAEDPGPFVPAGKRFVIEYVSANAALSGGAMLLEVGIKTHLNGTYGGYHYLVPTFTGQSVVSGTNEGDNLFSMSHPIRMYADGDTALYLFARRNDKSAGLEAFVRFTISGYLIDLL